MESQREPGMTAKDLRNIWSGSGVNKPDYQDWLEARVLAFENHRIDPNPDNEKTEVKLPERENPPRSVYMNYIVGRLKRERQNGWNACLDEVKRLNNIQ